MTALERKRLVEARKKNSTAWRVIHWLGSLQLALILLATIAIACAAATIAESEFSTKIAQVYIYKAPWFIVWLAVLCINLFAVTLTRWPWEKSTPDLSSPTTASSRGSSEPWWACTQG
ncbi:MAG: hypothetical protein ACKOF3_07380, partial [Spartobacteria bacterium]